MSADSDTTNGTGTQAVRRTIDAVLDTGRKALVGYLPAGFPDKQTSIACMRALVAGGCDVVEVGLPYSDPVMDGPAIQAAADRALAAGTRIADVLDVVTAVADAGAVPVVMTYWAPVVKYGVDRFATALKSAGGQGLITPDLIPDEAGEWTGISDRLDLGRIYLVAPSSTPERLAMTTAQCTGFVYAASAMGVTGVRDDIGSAAPRLVARTREVTDLPIGVGLGVRTPEQAREVAGYADAVIVGSAFVHAAGTDDPARAVGDLAADLRAAVEQP